MLGSNPGELRIRHWLSDALTTRLHLIHALLHLIRTATSHPIGYIASMHGYISSNRLHLIQSATSHPLGHISYTHGHI
ncbi:MAG: hypothetical protein ACK55Z_07945, partial [bacterium]